MSEIPPSTPIVNPIKQLASNIITNIFSNKQFETNVPLQSGWLFWKKNHLIYPGQPAYDDLVKELKDKGYEVKYKPYHEMPLDAMHGFYPKCTNIKVKPSEFEKTIIIIDNDPF